MGEETTETVEAPVEPKSEGSGLRAQLEKTLAENRELKAEKLTDGLVAIGLNENDGLGKAIAKDYSGEYSKEAIAAFADTEYGHKFDTPPAMTPQGAVIQQTQAQIDAASQGAGSVPVTPTGAEALASAEAEGNYKKTMAIKSDQIASMFD